MIRFLFTGLLRVVLRVFFSEVAVAGADRVPSTGPLLFVLNHPNALVDPAVLLCCAPRKVSFLAKSSLFDMPVIGTVVRAFDALPVYRREDAPDQVGRNEETFAAARQLLAAGAAVAIFPEGTTHTDASLRQLKTGAARLALGAQLRQLQIVPAGLYFDDRTIFRSRALLYFGEPFEVDSTASESPGDSDVTPARALTDRIGEALATVTLQAEGTATLNLSGRVQALFSSRDDDAIIAQSFTVQRRLVAGHGELAARHPEQLAAFVAHLADYERELRSLGIGLDQPMPDAYPWHRSLAFTLRKVTALLLLAPLGLLGIVTNWIPYRILGLLASKAARDDDDVLLATFKILGSWVIFPLGWLAIGVAVGSTWDSPWVGLASVVVTILAGWAALSFLERLAELGGATRVFVLFLSRRRRWDRLHTQRSELQARVRELATLVNAEAVPGEQQPTKG